MIRYIHISKALHVKVSILFETHNMYTIFKTYFSIRGKKRRKMLFKKLLFQGFKAFLIPKVQEGFSLGNLAFVSPLTILSLNNHYVNESSTATPLAIKQGWGQSGCSWHWSILTDPLQDRPNQMSVLLITELSQNKRPFLPKVVCITWSILKAE